MKIFSPPENGFWYLATVYRKHPHGLGAAYIDACQLSAKLWELRIPNFSPIAHGHGLSVHGGLPPDDHEMWMNIDRHFMVSAFGILVPQMQGWLESEGMQEEIETFDMMDRPIITFKPSTLLPEMPDGDDIPPTWNMVGPAGIQMGKDKGELH